MGDGVTDEQRAWAKAHMSTLAEPMPQLAPTPQPPQSLAALPYDLAADLRDREALATKQLGPNARTKTTRNAWLLVAPSAAGLGANSAFVERTLAAYMNDRFATEPQRALSVYLFSNDATYQAYCKKELGAKCISIYGFYEPSSRALVMNVSTGLGTLSHELVHPIVEADFPRAPTWINEGIASLFEQPVFPREGEVHGAKNWRYRRISEGLASKTERPQVSLAALFAWDDTTFRDEQETLHYAVARYACQWMDEKGWLWPFYKRWRDHVEEDPSGRASFAAVTGASVEDADARWMTWLKRI